MAYQGGCYWRSHEHILQYTRAIQGNGAPYVISLPPTRCRHRRFPLTYSPVSGYWAKPKNCTPGEGFGGLFMQQVNQARSVLHFSAPARVPRLTHLGFLLTRDVSALPPRVSQQTFPHPDHLFVNLGEPGARIHHFARSWCNEQGIPDEARRPAQNASNALKD